MNPAAAASHAATRPAQYSDDALWAAVRAEGSRQEAQLELIASENHTSREVIAAMGTVLTNKYAEGYPGKRYYGGCEHVDVVEDIARDRAKLLFGAAHANVQAHSGTQANIAALMALLKPRDKVLAMSLDHGGHLSHGSPVNFSGRHYKVVGYGVRPSDCMIDPDEVRSLAKEHRPSLIIAGATAYSRKIDWKLFREVADEVGAVLMADIAHYSGLVAGGAYPSPVPFADIVTTTTHKTLRGPRSGMVMGREVHKKAINKAVFPGLQGGPHMHTIAAKAVMLREALTSDFKSYAVQVVKNAQALSAALIARGLQVVSGGTDSHLLVVDLRPMNVTGKVAEETCDKVGITGNKNTVPFDPQLPSVCSGIRLGTPALTTRGMREKEMEHVAAFIVEALASAHDEAKLASVREGVVELSRRFPLYRHRLVS